jgi:hypothetical protein
MATATSCGVVLRLRISRTCGIFFWVVVNVTADPATAARPVVIRAIAKNNVNEPASPAESRGPTSIIETVSCASPAPLDHAKKV